MVMQMQQVERTDTRRLTEEFERIGAKIEARLDLKLGREVRLDVDSSAKGEVFDIAFGDRALRKIVDVEPKLRQILLGSVGATDGEQHYLCGRDESHWFVASVPELRGGVRNVADAFEALKPGAVLESQARHGLSDAEKLTRQNAAYKRQGEWFFVPRAKLIVPKDQIRQREPVMRPRGKPHYLEYAFRKGGRPVMVCQAYLEGLPLDEWRKLVRKNRTAREYEWTEMRADPRLFARGLVTHSDHKPMYLHGWHEVFISREGESLDWSVRFLD